MVTQKSVLGMEKDKRLAGWDRYDDSSIRFSILQIRFENVISMFMIIIN